MTAPHALVIALASLTLWYFPPPLRHGCDRGGDPVSVIVRFTGCVTCNVLVAVTDSDAYYCSQHSGTGKVERVSDVAEDDDTFFGPTPS